MTQGRPCENPEPAAARHAERSSGQFGVRGLMTATVAVAGLCWIFFTLPTWLCSLFLLFAMLLSMPMTLAALIYGTGRTRAFAVGATPPMCIVFLSLLGLPVHRRESPIFRVFNDFGFDYLDEKIFFLLATIVVVGSGFVGQAVRWWCLRADSE